jgi:hypothetical protein
VTNGIENKFRVSISTRAKDKGFAPKARGKLAEFAGISTVEALATVHQRSGEEIRDELERDFESKRLARHPQPSSHRGWTNRTIFCLRWAPSLTCQPRSEAANITTEHRRSGSRLDKFGSRGMDRG